MQVGQDGELFSFSAGDVVSSGKGFTHQHSGALSSSSRVASLGSFCCQDEDSVGYLGWMP